MVNYTYIFYIFQCLEEFWEEAFIEAMFEDMLDEEEEVLWLLDGLSPEDRVELVHELRQLSIEEGEESMIPEVSYPRNEINYEMGGVLY